MKNLDLQQAKRTEIMLRMSQANKDGDVEGASQAFFDLVDLIQEAVVDEAKGIVQSADSGILSGRGVRQLTSEENKYFQSIIESMKSSNPQQALTDMDDVMPKTVIDAVFEDLKTEHPLLQKITFENTSGQIEKLINKNGVETATWGDLTDTIVKELTSGFEKFNISLYKLSAFLPVAKSTLDLGPAWLDRYVRAILAEALANGLEYGIIKGTGKKMPIGMCKQVGEGVVVTDGVYPDKTQVAVTSFDPVSYGSLLAGMAVGPNSKTRVVTEVILIVNPVDYLQKVFPATTIRRTDGTYAKDIFPFPTTVIQSIQVDSGKAIIGIAKRYFMGVGTAKSGEVLHSDEYKFLEDERTYLVKLYGNGEPLDNTAFVYADISNLKAAVHSVFVTNDEGDPIPMYPAYDARLASLALGSLTLSPTFNKSTHDYTAATTDATNAITAVALDGEGTIEILVNDVEHTNGTAATWNAGANTVEITVTSGTETETYTVTVTKS